MARVDKYTDETLMAYADGELSPDDAQRLERDMVDAPDLRDRVAMFDRQRTMARAAYADILSEPVPDRLLDTLKAKPEPAWRRWLGGSWLGGSLSTIPAGRGMAAALVLLAVGIGVGIYGPSMLGLRSGGQEIAGSFGGARLDARLVAVLEKTPSGKKVDFSRPSSGSNLSITARSTFRKHDGQPCRDYEQKIRSSKRQVLVSGVACRDNRGRWHSVVAIAAPLGAANADPGFRPASSGLSDLIDAVQDKIIEGAPLTAADEARLLKSGWQTK